MREIDDRSQLDEAVDQALAGAAEPAAGGLGQPSAKALRRFQVKPTIRTPSSQNASKPPGSWPSASTPSIDSRRPIRPSVCRSPRERTGHDALLVLAHESQERPHLVEHGAKRGLRIGLERRRHGAHLQPDAARLELRQPVTLEEVVPLALPVAVHQLQQEVVVRVCEGVGQPLPALQVVLAHRAEDVEDRRALRAAVRRVLHAAREDVALHRA